MLYAPVRHCEYTELEMPAPQALGSKFRSANRGNPKMWRSVHQTKNLLLLTKVNSKVQAEKHNSVPGFSAFSGAFQWH